MSNSSSELEVQKHVFVKGDGHPVQFFFHPSVTSGQKAKLGYDVVRYGGNVSDEELAADVVVVDHEFFEEISRRHSHSRHIYVEEGSFIKRCVDQNEYYHEKPLRKPMGGRRSGSARVEFTQKDDRDLAAYLALRIPRKESGGRHGNVVYMELISDLQYDWAERHSWQSWQNRYKKDAARFDIMIEEVLACNPPRLDGKGEYHLVRSPIREDGRNGGDYSRLRFGDGNYTNEVEVGRSHVIRGNARGGSQHKHAQSDNWGLDGNLFKRRRVGTEGDVKVPNSDFKLCELNKCSVEAGRSTDSKTTSDASSREKSFRESGRADGAALASQHDSGNCVTGRPVVSPTKTALATSFPVSIRTGVGETEYVMSSASNSGDEEESILSQRYKRLRRGGFNAEFLTTPVQPRKSLSHATYTDAAGSSSSPARGKRATRPGERVWEIDIEPYIPPPGSRAAAELERRRKEEQKRKPT